MKFAKYTACEAKYTAREIQVFHGKQQIDTKRDRQKDTKEHRDIQHVRKKKDKKNRKKGRWKNTNGYEQRQVEGNGQTQRGIDEQK